MSVEAEEVERSLAGIPPRSRYRIYKHPITGAVRVKKKGWFFWHWVKRGYGAGAEIRDFGSVSSACDWVKDHIKEDNIRDAKWELV